MPNITSKHSYRETCGNDKCGTFAPAKLREHHGGKAMPASGHPHGAFASHAKRIASKRVHKP